jgi:hypothetical protein
MIFMNEAKIWSDIECISIATGKHEDDVYAELMIDFQKLVSRKFSYGT